MLGRKSDLISTYVERMVETYLNYIGPKSEHLEALSPVDVMSVNRMIFMLGHTFKNNAYLFKLNSPDHLKSFLNLIIKIYQNTNQGNN